MPFTPFHFGPALGLGLPLRKYVHARTFIVANIVVDVEPLLVHLFVLRYPLHGYLHTFFSAFFVGLALGYVMFRLERILHPLYEGLLPKADNGLTLKSFMVAGVFGTCLHVLLDSPLYTDIQPFYPITANPLLNPDLTLGIYSLCVGMGILGMVYYLGLPAFSVR